MFGFKVSNLLFGPVTIKAKLMTTSIRDTENIVLPLQLTVRNVAKVQAVYTVFKHCYCCEVQSKVHSPGLKNSKGL